MQNHANTKNSRIRPGTSQLDRSRLERERDLTPSRIINSSKNIRLSSQVVIAKGDNSNITIEKVPVNSLMEESKRLTAQPEDTFANQNLSGMELIDNIISILLPTGGYHKVSPTSLFPFKRDKIIKLCEEAAKVFLNSQGSKSDSLVGVRAPVKVFGGLYGRYYDLLKMFENFGIPDDREM